MFSDAYGLTEAVLSGRKTQTRRIIPQSVVKKASEYQLKYFEATLDAISEMEAIEQIYFVERLAKLPYQVGEVVAVAQSYKEAGVADYPTPIDDIYYEACNLPGWANKLFTKASLLPHQIRITDVRVERLRDITEADCIAEGVEKVKECEDLYRIPIFHKSSRISYIHGSSPRAVYAALIDKISGRGTWESNPWVFVYDFELVN